MVKCQNCHAQLGSCRYCHNCNEHNSRLITGPAPKEEKMATDFRTKACGQCGYFWSDSYTGTHCRRTALKMTSGEIPACPSFVAALEGE